MKKIALIFTILCVSQLYGIEPAYEIEPECSNYIDIGMSNLSKETQEILVANICIDDTLNNVINAIKATSASNATLNAIVNKKHGNLKGFETLVHMLANRFKKDPAYIANKFKTPASIHYMRLSVELIDATMRSDVEQVKQLIKQGADTNYATGPDSPLYLAAIEKNNPPTVQLLLDAGAKPTIKDSSRRTMLEYVKINLWHAQRSEEHEMAHALQKIDHMFKEAVKQQPPSPCYGVTHTKGMP